MAVPLLVWSGWFLAAAYKRWSWEHVCSMVCGPFIPVELVADYRRSTDWHTPLSLALLPLALLASYWLLRAILKRLAR